MVRLSLLREVVRLPRLQITLHVLDRELGRRVYHHHTRRHPRYRLIGNKTLGVGLIQLAEFEGVAEYLDSINGKNSAAYYARKALRRGYRISIIDRNEYVDDIFQINTSIEARQGQKMASAYQERQSEYPVQEDYRYFGVLDETGRLHAYCWLLLAGEVATADTLLGHAETLNDGTMYLLMTRIVEWLYEQGTTDYLMYDTFYGASDGLVMFKRKLGFRPYRVSWRLAG